MNAIAIINEINETNEMNEMIAIVILSILLLVGWFVLLRNSSKTKDTITTLTNKINVLENKLNETKNKINGNNKTIFEHLNELNETISEHYNEINEDICTNYNELNERIHGNNKTIFELLKKKIEERIKETEINILNIHNTNINDQLINFKELITDHVTHTELEQTVNRCVAFQHLSTASNIEYNPCNSDITISGVNSTTLKFSGSIMTYSDFTNPSKGSYSEPQDYYLRTIKCNGIYYNYMPKHGYIFNSNSKKIERGNNLYYPAGKYDLKTHSIEFYN